MNLAKIRQKARSRKIIESKVEAVSQTAIDLTGISDNSDSCFVSEELSMADVFEVASTPDSPDVPGTLTETVRAKRDSDPVKVILAGREAAECDGSLQSDSAEPLPVVTENYAEFLSVRIADELYGIDIMRIKEIIKPRPVTEVPRSPVFLPGVISLRGVITPVIDMLSRLGFSIEADKDNQRIVVVRVGQGFAGLLVDEVIQVLRIDRESIEPVPAVLEGVDREFISGIGRCDSRMIILLNLDSIADINLY